MSSKVIIYYKVNNDILRTKYNYFHFNAGIACQQFLLNLINSLPLSTDDIDDKFIDYFLKHFIGLTINISFLIGTNANS